MKDNFTLAKETAIKAGVLILKYFNADYEIQNKSYNNPVTTADKEADKLIKKNLLAANPNYGWLSEETKDSPDRLEKKFVWVVDPIDGTKEFIKGIPEFVVSIGLVKNGEPVVGVIYNPITKEIFSAKKNGGSFLNDTTVKCIAKENISDMILLNSRTETRNRIWAPYENFFYKLKPIGSVAYKLALVAAGKADIFATLKPKNECDICAAHCIINESGGKLIDLDGDSRIYNLKNTRISPGIIAGGEDAVKKVSSIIKRV